MSEGRKATLTLPASREIGWVEKLGLVGKAVAAAAKSEMTVVKNCMMDSRWSFDGWCRQQEDMNCSCSRICVGCWWVLDKLVVDGFQEQLMVDAFDDGCKDIVVVESNRGGYPSGFVKKQDGRAQQEAASHVIIRVGGSSFPRWWTGTINTFERVSGQTSKESAPLLIATSSSC